MTKEPGKSPERAPRPRLRPKPSGARGGSDLKAPEARPKPGRQRKRARKEPGKSPAPKAPPEPLVFFRFGAAVSGVSRSLRGSGGEGRSKPNSTVVNCHVTSPGPVFFKMCGVDSCIFVCFTTAESLL